MDTAMKLIMLGAAVVLAIMTAMAIIGGLICHAYHQIPLGFITALMCVGFYREFKKLYNED